MKLRYAIATVFLLHISLLLSSAAAAPPSCSDELVQFSVCLPFIASSPNNLTDTPPQQCCDHFSSSSASLCLCYFVHQPLILGFPINSSRIFHIPSLCPNLDHAPRPKISLHSLCSGSPKLPPLHSIAGPDYGQQGAAPEQQSQDAGSPDKSNVPEPSAADSPPGPEDGQKEPLPEQQPSGAGDFDDYIVPGPTADSLTEPNSTISTSSRSSTAMSMKDRCRWVLLPLFLLYLQKYASSLA